MCGAKRKQDATAKITRFFGAILFFVSFLKRMEQPEANSNAIIVFETISDMTSYGIDSIWMFFSSICKRNENLCSHMLPKTGQQNIPQKCFFFALLIDFVLENVHEFRDPE